MVDFIRANCIDIDAAMVDLAGRLQPFFLINLMQNAANDNATDFGASREDMLAKGVIWVISRLDIEIQTFPVLNDTILVKTWFGPVRKWLWSRYYQICRPNGEVLIQASSVWVLLDYKTREVAIPSKLNLDLPEQMVNAPQIMPLPPKIKCPDDMVAIGSKMPAYSDVDLNMHMNNVAYIRLLCDALPVNYFEDHAFSRLTINYLNEAHMNECLHLHLKNDGKKFYFAGTSNKQEIFTCYGTWQDAPKMIL